MLFTNEIYSQFYNVIHVHRIIFFQNFKQFSKCRILRTKCVLTKFVKSDVNRLYLPKISYKKTNKQRPQNMHKTIVVRVKTHYCPRNLSYFNSFQTYFFKTEFSSLNDIKIVSHCLSIQYHNCLIDIKIKNYNCADTSFSKHPQQTAFPQSSVKWTECYDVSPPHLHSSQRVQLTIPKTKSSK